MENSKKLVVYYSYTGHTKMIAESIQKQLNCDILEIKPVKPYSTDYQTVVNEEQNNSSVNKVPEIQKLCPNSKVEKGMNIVFTEDCTENQLVTAPDEIDEWIDEL